MNATADLKTEIIEICQLMTAQGLVAGTEGNISARAPDGSILMTPSGFSKGDITVDMLLRLDLDGNLLEGKLTPTSERGMHLALYRARPGVMGVVHGHPIHATAFAVAGRDLPDGIMPELTSVIGAIATVPYGQPGTPELAAAFVPYIPQHNVFLLQNHGVTAVGVSVREAYHRLQVTESYAKMVWVAEALGGVQSLSDVQIAALPKPHFR